MFRQCSRLTSVKSLCLWSFWSNQVNILFCVKMLTKHILSDSPRRVSEDFTPIDYFPIQGRHCDSTVQQEWFIYISTWETICILHYSKYWRGKEVYTQRNEWQHFGRGKSMLLKGNATLSLHMTGTDTCTITAPTSLITIIMDLLLPPVQFWYMFHIGIMSSEWIGSLVGWSVQVQVQEHKHTTRSTRYIPCYKKMALHPWT